MKLLVVFLVVFAVFVVNSVAQSYNIIDDRPRAESEDDADDRDSNKLPIPIISDKVAAAIAEGSKMLTETLQATVSEEYNDKTKVLNTVHMIFLYMDEMLDSLYTGVAGAVTNRITTGQETGLSIADIVFIFRGAGESVITYFKYIEGKIKPSELSECLNAMKDLIQKVSNLNEFMPKTRSPYDLALFDKFHRGNKRDNYNQGLDLEAVIFEWSTAIEGIANAVKVFAKAIQKVVTSRILAITVQKSVKRSLSISGSYLSMVSTQLNDALENVRTKLGMSSQKSVTQVNQAYSSITSNPTKWHQSLLNKLYAFLGSYSGFVNTEYLHTVASSVKTAELEIAFEIITQTRKSGQKIDGVVTYITDTAAASTNPRASSECSMKQLMKLNPSSLNSLAQCANMEANNIKALPTQGQEQLTMAKDNAVSIVSQLTVCNGGSDNCYKQFLTVFDSMKTTAKKDLKAAGTQVESSLQAISQRIKDCLKAAAGEIEKTVDKAKEDFDFCLKF